MELSSQVPYSFQYLLGIVAYMVQLFIGRSNHIGFPMETLSLDNMTTLMKVTLGIEVTYYLIVSFIKISILLMYLRFAVDPLFRRLTIGTIIFHCVFCVVCLIVTTNQCTPLKKWWDMSGTIDGHCINTTAFFYSTSSINIVTDFWILGLPIASLVKINRSQKEKYALMAVFGVGCFAAITSIIRLKSIREYTQATDPFLSALSVNLWSMIETNTAIICASVPALKPLFSPSRLRGSSNSNNSDDFSKPNKLSGTTHVNNSSMQTSGSDEVYDLEHDFVAGHSANFQRCNSMKTSQSTEKMIQHDAC
ncbi:hypothetical protein BROUX41_004355 [Berkeleyomyces rouxiae]